MGDALTPAERSSILAFSFKHWKQHSPYMKGLLALTLKRSGRPKDARARVGERHGFREDRPRPRHVLGAGGPLLALVQRHDRDAGVRAAHAHGARSVGLATPRPRAVALPQQEDEPVEVHPRDRRGHLLAGLVLEEGGRARRPRGRVRRGRRTEDDVRFRAGPVHGQAQPGRHSGGEDRPADRLDDRRLQGAARGSPSPRRRGTSRPRSCRRRIAATSSPCRGSTSGARRRPRASPSRRCRRVPRSRRATRSRSRSRSRRSTPPSTSTCATRAPRAWSRASSSRATSGISGSRWYEETRDSGANFFFEQLPAGEYTLKYRVRANMAGTFRVGPATVQSLYAPEFNAYSSGATVTVR